MTECAAKMNIKRIVVFNLSDLHFDEQGRVRLKRKYGKFQRIGYEIPTEKGKNELRS